jgi:hypothetical protein
MAYVISGYNYVFPLRLQYAIYFYLIQHLAFFIPKSGGSGRVGESPPEIGKKPGGIPGTAQNLSPKTALFLALA